jgi:hypothetical protein
MSIEMGFTEAIMLFCAIALLFRLEGELPAMLATVRSGFRSVGSRLSGHQRSDFYCFFHSKALLGR